MIVKLCLRLEASSINLNMTNWWTLLHTSRRPPLHHAPQRRRRTRGKRGGLRVRLEAHLRSVHVSDRCSDLHFLEVPLALHWRRTRDRWIRPVFPDVGGFDSVSCSSDPDQLLLPSSWRAHNGKRGVICRNLRSLKRASSSSDTFNLQLALLNVRSVTNKTFFTSRKLDFMSLTETWLREGELAPFSELPPPWM